ncbi:MAG: glycosyl hydrolase family 18 protein, partial [Bacillota bacterium]|nr:glycosyl hydrolase family 18 protein [Bacillota bacterium]
MKRYLALIVLSTLIQGSALVGCGGNQYPPQRLTQSQVEDNGQTPQAEASSKDVPGSSKRIILGFCTDAGKNSKDSIIQNINVINEVVFFWYSFDGTGKINRSDNVDLSLKATAQKGGAKVLALVHNLNNKGFDQQIAHQLLSNPSARTKFINNLVNLVTNENWDGICIDIEKTLTNDRDNYSAFISELNRSFNKSGKILNVCVP